MGWTYILQTRGEANIQNDQHTNVTVHVNHKQHLPFNMTAGESYKERQGEGHLWTHNDVQFQAITEQVQLILLYELTPNAQHICQCWPPLKESGNLRIMDQWMKKMKMR